jgi:uncharacterized membrane protein
MTKFRVAGLLLCLVLVFSVLGGLAGDGIALAVKEGGNGSLAPPPNQEQPVADNLTLSAQYPVLQAKSGDSFSFEVEFLYLGVEDRTFELTLDTPQNWVAQIQPQYDTTAISAIRLKSFQSYADKVKVVAVPYPWALPAPGEYIITLAAKSGDLKATFDLKAVVTARYEMDFYTETGLLNTKATAGKENHVAVKVRNSGSAAIEKITLSSTKPEGWSITFKPENAENLEPEFGQDVDVIIKPPAKAIAGDYMVTLTAEGKEVSKNMELRVTVLTPTIWGWVGIGIVLVVIAGLAFLFRQLGRR